MYKKYIIGTVLLVFVFESVVSTGFLFNALKNTVQNTRCKLHNIGSKIIQHNHHHGGPCASAEISNEADGNYGNSDFGTHNGAQVNGNFDHQPLNSYGCMQPHQCMPDKTCFNNKCVDPCPGACGFNAKCQTKNHQPVCTCAPDFTGNPYIECVMLTQGVGLQESTTGTSSIVTNTNRNEIKKGSSDEVGNNGPSTNSYDDLDKNIKDIFGGPDSNNRPQDSSGQQINAGNSNGDSKNHISTSTHETVKFEESENGDGSATVTSDIKPLVVDIDVRASAVDSLQSETTRKYIEVPKGGGRNIIKVNCPSGTTATKDGECLEEF